MFRGRLMFPIHDLQGRPIALGGRLIPAIARSSWRQTLAASTSMVARRCCFASRISFTDWTSARDAIRREGKCLVMEGYTDVVAARQSGIEPVVAVLGTALGEQHVKILKRFAERVVLVLGRGHGGTESGR